MRRSPIFIASPRRLAAALAAASIGCLGALPAAASDASASSAKSPAAAPETRKAEARRPEVAKAESAKAEGPKVDPVERLRERLAERLSAVKAQPATNDFDLRVSSKTLAAAPAPALAPAARHGTRRGGAERGKADAPHWSYSGEVGPQAWAGMKPEFSLCASGQRQSPIDIREGLAVDLEPVRFNYRPSAFAVIDNGHTVQVNLAPGNTIELGGRSLELLQFHFHRPSEERIDGRQFDMVVHLVHKDAEGRLAVVAVLLERGSAQPVVQAVWNNLPLEKQQEVQARVSIDVNQLLPTERRYYTYMGSLTTPPCSEGVQWVVMRHPVAMAPEQIELFSRLYPMNARPLQAAGGRRIMQSN